MGIDVWEHAYFSGRVRGEASCATAPPNPCNIVDVTMHVRGKLRDAQTGTPAGRLELEMQGTLVRNGEPAAWSELNVTSSGIQVRVP